MNKTKQTFKGYAQRTNLGASGTSRAAPNARKAWRVASASQVTMSAGNGARVTHLHAHPDGTHTMWASHRFLAKGMYRQKER